MTIALTILAAPQSPPVPTWLEVLGIVGTVVGGIGAGVGAVAAWRAAKRSAESSRVALDALALGIKPSLTTHLTWMTRGNDEIPGAVIRNESDWDAIDVEVEVFRKDGTRLKDSRHRLSAERTSETDEEESMDVSLGEISRDSEDYEYGGLELFVDRVCVRFSDYRNIARYEWCRYWDYERSSDDEFQTYGGRVWESEKQIR